MTEQETAQMDYYEGHAPDTDSDNNKQCDVCDGSGWMFMMGMGNHGIETVHAACIQCNPKGEKPLA